MPVRRRTQKYSLYTLSMLRAMCSTLCTCYSQSPHTRFSSPVPSFLACTVLQLVRPWYSVLLAIVLVLQGLVVIGSFFNRIHYELAVRRQRAQHLQRGQTPSAPRAKCTLRDCVGTLNVIACFVRILWVIDPMGFQVQHSTWLRPQASTRSHDRIPIIIIRAYTRRPLSLWFSCECHKLYPCQAITRRTTPPPHTALCRCSRQCVPLTRLVFGAAVAAVPPSAPLLHCWLVAFVIMVRMWELLLVSVDKVLCRPRLQPRHHLLLKHCHSCSPNVPGSVPSVRASSL